MGVKRAALPYHNRQQQTKGITMKKLGYIYAVILYVFKKKISVEDALEMIRAKILEPDEETMPKQMKSHKKRKVA